MTLCLASLSPAHGGEAAPRQTVPVSSAQASATEMDTAAWDALVGAEVAETGEPPAAVPRAKAIAFNGIVSHAKGNGGRGKDGATLRSVLARVLSENQELAAARAQLRAVAEQLPQARAALLPLIAGTASANAERAWDSDNPGGVTETNSADVGIELKQVLFDGFRGINNMTAARAQIEAERKAYLSLQNTVLLNTATAYMSVLRDRRVADLRRRNLDFLTTQMKAAKVRFEIGEGTITDVAQSESESALAQSLLETALADVAASEAAYNEIVGLAPAKLQPPVVGAISLPVSLEAAKARAEANSPAIQSARHLAEAASSRVDSAKAGFLPSLDLTASAKRDFLDEVETGVIGLPGVRLDRQDETKATVGVKLTVPLFQGGRVVSEVRQARETYDQKRIEVGRAHAKVVAATATAWARLKAARQNVKGFAARLRATQTALESVAEEQQVGQRTTLDVLNAQADVISSQIQLLDAERTLIISIYALLAAMGEMPA